MPIRISKNRVSLENIPLNESIGANIASAATVNLTTATGNTVHITGTTAITAVTLGAGMIRDVIFDGVLTLTHHATNNHLPGGANITTAANDRARYISDGTTVYCVNYQKADGTAVVVADVTIGNHEVVVHTGNGFGSVNTRIRRFTTILINVGTAITYVDSVANGASFTINETGLYSIYYMDRRDGGPSIFGASLNTASPTTNIHQLPVTEVICYTTEPTAGYETSTSRVVRLLQGDVVRPHTDGNTSSIGTFNYFAIRKIGT